MVKLDVSDLVVKANAHNNVFLVDLSWVLYKSWYSYYKGQGLSVELQDGIEKPTGHIFGVLRALIAMKKRDNNCMIVLCKDGRPVDRKDENEDYKAGRTGVGDYNIFSDLEDTIDMCFMIPDVYVAYNPVLEADDILYSLAKRMEEMTTITNIYIYTSDNDLLQAISDRVLVCKKITNSTFTVVDEEYMRNNKAMIRNFRYCPPKKLPFYRSIIGDKSDNLKGLYRFPRELATRIAGDIDSLDDILDLKYDDLTPAKKKHLQKCKDQFALLESNYKLMNLKKDIDFEVWRDESDECSWRAGEYIEKYKMSYLAHYLKKNNIKYNYMSGDIPYDDFDEFVSW